WEAATALLTRLSSSPDAKISASAKVELEDLPYWKKYGVPPVHASASSASKPATAPASTSAAPVSKNTTPPPPAVKASPAPAPRRVERRKCRTAGRAADRQASYSLCERETDLRRMHHWRWSGGYLLEWNQNS